MLFALCQSDLASGCTMQFNNLAHLRLLRTGHAHSSFSIGSCCTQTGAVFLLAQAEQHCVSVLKCVYSKACQSQASAHAKMDRILATCIVWTVVIWNSFWWSNKSDIRTIYDALDYYGLRTRLGVDCVSAFQLIGNKAFSSPNLQWTSQWIKI